MATNEELRRQSGLNNQNARRQIGVDNQNARRALDQQMVERRTGKSQAADINSVVNVPRRQQSLGSVEPRGPLIGQVGTGSYVAPPAGTGGGGIASPLTEVESTRVYHEFQRVIQSTDGSLFMAVYMPAQVTMVDADGREVVFNYSGNVNG